MSEAKNTCSSYTSRAQPNAADHSAEQALGSSLVDLSSMSRKARLSFSEAFDELSTTHAEAAVAETIARADGRAVRVATPTSARGSGGTKKAKSKRQGSGQRGTTATVVESAELCGALAAVDKLLTLLDHTQKVDRCAATARLERCCDAIL